MDVQNMAPQEMSIGELSLAQESLTGFVKHATDQMNAGQKPGVGGTGAGDILSSKFAAPQDGIIMNGAFPSAGVGVKSMFTSSPRRGRPRDALFGQEVGYREAIKQQRALQRAAYKFHMTGVMPEVSKDPTFRKAPDVFGQTGSKFADPKAPLPGVIYTPEMLINMNLLPQNVRQNREAVLGTQAAPKVNQIVEGLKTGEDSAENMFRNAPPPVKAMVKTAAPLAYKAAAPEPKLPQASGLQAPKPPGM